MRTNRTIDCQTGIYNTDYRLTCHKDGSVTVRVPGIVWSNNTGTLKHTNITIDATKSARDARRARDVKWFFAHERLSDDCGTTLDDIVLHGSTR